MAASDSSRHACELLSTALPGRVFTQDESSYNDAINGYFFANDRLLPQCIVRPQSAQEVSLIIQTLATTNTKVAIQGGGHTPNPGAANIDSGVTISMSAINLISFSHSSNQANDSISTDAFSSSPTQPTDPRVSEAISSNTAVVSVGAGATFGSLYAYLNAYNLIAVGGRGDSLGLGGLLTGGGVGFFGPRYGFACDNVVGYEIVLADGSIANINAQSHLDLFRALKGGSNNFGIVTRFDLKTYSQGPLWGGFVNYPESAIPAQLDAIRQFMNAETRDPNAALIASLGYVGAYEMTLASNGLHYAKSGDTDPQVFRPFTSIQPQTSSSLRIGSLVNLVNEVESMQAPGSRTTYVTTTFAPSPTIFDKIYTLWNSSLPELKPINNLTHFLVFQNFPAIHSGNSLGLEAGDEKLIILVLSVSWGLQQDDALIEQSTQALIGQIEQATKAEGVFRRFKHLNYAAGWQDPINGYGEANKLELQAVSRRYDPHGFFQKKVPGGFKVLG